MSIRKSTAKALRLRPGDGLVHEIANELVIEMRSFRSVKHDRPFRVFSEWNSEADAKGYAEL